MADGLEITNPDATPNPSSHVICQRSGFKYKPGVLVQEWNGLWVHPKYAEPKHPSDFGTPNRAERLTGSPRPESKDIFVSENEVTADDL